MVLDIQFQNRTVHLRPMSDLQTLIGVITIDTDMREGEYYITEQLEEYIENSFTIQTADYNSAECDSGCARRLGDGEDIVSVMWTPRLENTLSDELMYDSFFTRFIFCSGHKRSAVDEFNEVSGDVKFSQNDIVILTATITEREDGELGYDNVSIIKRNPPEEWEENSAEETEVSEEEVFI